MGNLTPSTLETAACLKSFGSRRREPRKLSGLQIFAEVEQHTEGAGVRFAGKLDFTLGHLRVHPEMAPMFEEPVGRLVIGSTGFGLFYSVEARIIVHALIHLSRDPQSIRERIRRLLSFD